MYKKASFYINHIKSIPDKYLKHKSIKNKAGDKIKIHYLSEEGYKIYLREHNIDNPVIIGFTQLKKFKNNQEAEMLYENMGMEPFIFDVSTKDKSFCHYRAGYINVQSEVNKNRDFESTQFICVKKFDVLALLFIPAFFLMLIFLLWGLNTCQKSPKQTIVNNADPNVSATETTSSFEYESSAQLGGELPTGKDSIAGSDSIEAALYDANKIYLSKSSQTIDLINPAGNTVDFQYFIYSDEDNMDLLFSSKLIAPGKYIKWNAYDICASGNTTLYVTVKTFDVDSHSECNGYTTKMQIIK